MSQNTLNCPKCGHQNPEGQENCQSCGAEIGVYAPTMQNVDVYGATMVETETSQAEEEIPRASLTIEAGRFKGRVYTLKKNQTLGREKCEIILRDPHLSRQHANIKYLEGQFLLLDLGSANHTFVNDQMIQHPTPLQDGDLISMGNTDLRFTLKASE